ncbi:hypothetical protein PPYR_05098 [Photinus pyralis]|uniref:Peroxisomal membrane protein 11C n=1 Tax=Photinus pyralis TaxID=7054 RepID=A0A1Y1N4Z2_PHOPY|nr:peroxisomal membrane protein 11C-like [Photinus pyralis]KAB0802912.1 hypothetical protein PPYR_05098 [Photinus pyralis]
MDKISKFILQDVCDVLDTYRGRDKFIRTLCYTSKLIGSCTCDEVLAKRCQTFSSQMSATRAVLRLFDDLPMLRHSLQYGLGKQEPDQFMASVGVVGNIVDQLYFPVDKIAWLADLKLINVENSKFWETASTAIYVVSLYLNLIRTVRYLNVLHKHKECVSSEADKSALTKLIVTEQTEYLTFIRLALDLVHAVNCLPSGFLWSSKLNSWQVGVVGTLSSLVGLYQMFAKKHATE